MDYNTHNFHHNYFCQSQGSYYTHELINLSLSQKLQIRSEFNVKVRWQQWLSCSCCLLHAQVRSTAALAHLTFYVPVWEPPALPSLPMFARELGTVIGNDHMRSRHSVHEHACKHVRVHSRMHLHAFLNACRCVRECVCVRCGRLRTRPWTWQTRTRPRMHADVSVNVSAGFYSTSSAGCEHYLALSSRHEHILLRLATIRCVYLMKSAVVASNRTIHRYTN